MKNMLLTSLALIGTALAAPAQEAREKPVYRDAETHEKIVHKLRVSNANNPMRKLSPSEGEDPSVKNQPQDLISSSDVLTFNGVTTLVPKMALIQIPARYAERVNNHIPGTRVVGWSEFYTLNRGWITTVEVSRAEAEGKVALPEAVSENLSTNTNLIVATYSTGPISVLPLKEPADEEGKTKATKP